MKVHNRMILTKLKIPSHAWDEQVAWVNGYILALEDILGDINKIRAETPERERNQRLLVKIQNKVTATWTQARATLVAMEEMEHEATDTAGRATGSPATGVSGPTGPEDQGGVPDPGAV